jgi:hypothetical protein
MQEGKRKAGEDKIKKFGAYDPIEMAHLRTLKWIIRLEMRKLIPSLAP